MRLRNRISSLEDAGKQRPKAEYIVMRPQSIEADKRRLSWNIGCLNSAGCRVFTWLVTEKGGWKSVGQEVS